MPVRGSTTRGYDPDSPTAADKKKADIAKAFAKFTVARRREISRFHKEEETVRRRVIREFDSTLKKVKKQMDKEYKETLKPVPAGYFRSKRTNRIIKDTPKNRANETMPAESKEEKASRLKAILDERLKLIEDEPDDRVKHALVRAVGVPDLFIWRTMSREQKLLAIRQVVNKAKKFNDAYGDSEIKKRVRDPTKPPKARTQLKYVDAPRADASPFGLPELTDVAHSSETDDSDDYFGDTDDSEHDSDFGETDTDRDTDTPKRHYETDWDKIIERSSLPLRDYQIKAVKWLQEHHGLVAAFDVGSGKTLTAVATSVCLLESGVVEKVIIVSPKSLFDNFNKELDAFIGLDDDGNPAEFGFDDCYENYTHTSFVNTFKSNPYYCDNALLIIDEAAEYRTNIKDDGSGKSAYAMINCCIRAKRVLCLTATPLVNSFSDVTNLVAMIRGESPLAIPPTLAGKVDYLREIFAFHTMATSKNDDPARTDGGFSPDLPSKRYHDHVFEMDEEYYEKYLKVQRSANDEAAALNAKGKKKDPFAFLTGLRHAMNSIQPNPKIEWALDRVADLGLKTIIYSGFIDDGIRILEKGLDERGVNYRVISGELDKDTRATAVKLYNDRKSDVNVLLISKAGSLGLDLKETREVIFIDPSWNPASEDQVEGRACRIGSHAKLPEDERFVDVHRLMLIKPPMDKLAPGDNVPSADSLLRGIVEGKRKELNRAYLLLKSVDIDPVKAAKYRELFKEEYLKDSNEGPLPAEFGDYQRGTSAERSGAKSTRDEGTFGSKPWESKDPYEILGVPKKSTPEVCQKAFRQLSLKLHPDRNYNATHEERVRNESWYKRAASALDYITGKDSRPMF